MGISTVQCTSVNFNPRSLTGATVISSALQASVSFQSTLPHGSDHNITSLKKIFKTNFNPRSLTGATRSNPVWYSIYKQFQSTLPHGSDTLKMFLSRSMFYFNPRSLTGATYVAKYSLKKQTGISIHAPSRERRSHMAKAAPAWEFQSTLPHGSDSVV